MTTPDLAEALAAQRDAFRPEHVPPFTDLLDRSRRRNRRRQALVVAATLATAAVIGGAVVALPTWSAPDTMDGGIASGQRAPLPDEELLRTALRELAPPLPLTAVQRMRTGDAGIGDRPREQLAGVTGQTADSTTSVSWAVVSPALSDAEALAIAGSIEGSAGREQGVPVGLVDHEGPVKTVSYRFGEGTFVAVWAWSTDGGVVTFTSGDGASVTDAQIRGWQRAAQDLLTA